MTKTKQTSAFLPLNRTISSIKTTIMIILGGVGFIGIGAHLDIPMVPVPMSMQTYTILVFAGLAGWRMGGVCVVAYIIAAAMGLPLFAGGASGWNHLSGATAGYIYGFIFTALLTGCLAERGWTLHFARSSIVMMVGHLLILVPGTLWLARRIGFDSALESGFTPFLFGAVVKSILAAATILGLRTMMIKK